MTDNSHKAEEINGKAKAAAGQVLDDQGLEAEGKTDQVRAQGKQAGDKVKDTVRGVADSLKDNPKQ